MPEQSEESEPLGDRVDEAHPVGVSDSYAPRGNAEDRWRFGER
jgi:hypothetical protein